MARFNEKTKGKDKVVNYEGDISYKLNDVNELYVTVACASLQPKFYESSTDCIKRIRELVSKVDPLAVAKLAVYAREKMYLRSIPLVLTVELAGVHNGDDLVSKTAERVIQRPDEITEMLSYYAIRNCRNDTKKFNKLSRQLQKGIAGSFNKFSEYQFAKYDREGTVTLRDALFLTHPKPKDDTQKAIFDKIANKTLETPYTWEVELSELGKSKFENEEAKEIAFRKKWEELIDSNKVGYMALLRNLRNILNAEVSTSYIKAVALTLSDKKNVLNSKQLPFRFLSAYRELQGLDNPLTPMILNALEDAVLHTAENIQGYDYDTMVVIACDVSGSMSRPISPRSKIENFDIGLILGMLLQNRCKSVITGIFGDLWKIKQVPSKAILQNVTRILTTRGEVGYSTNGWLVLNYMIKNNIKADKVMMFTDCQLWDSSGIYQETGTVSKLWAAYKEQVNPSAKLYLFDLAGYGNTPLKVNESDVYLIAGWSDKIFDVLSAIDKGGSALDEIDRIEL